MIKQVILVSWGLLFLASCQPDLPTQPAIAAADLQTHVSYLASDSLKGRYPGTPGDSLSAAYIANGFKQAGLAAIAGSYYQNFEITTGLQAGKNTSLSQDTATFSTPGDFVPAPYSINGQVEAPVTFAGYGLVMDTDTLQWNDFEDQAINDRWVLMLLGDPELDNDESPFVRFSGERQKVMRAADKGAAGVLLVAGQELSPKDELPELEPPRVVGQSQVPVLQISRAAANKILAPAETTIEALETQLNEQRQPASFAMETQLRGQVDLMPEKTQTQNVWGLLKAADNADAPYLLIGAHYDHLGMGGPESGSRVPEQHAVHNGADDNASGVATVMELAEYFANHPDKVTHHMLFVAFGAEEKGLLGSKYLAKHLPVDAENIRLMMNFDMVGRLDTTANDLTIGGVGTAKEMRDFLNPLLDTTLFQYNLSPEGYGASDHSSFYGQNIPVLFLTTGAHTDYHKPLDDANKLNYPGQEKVTRLAADILAAAQNPAQAFTFVETGIKRQSRHGSNLKVTFGIMPGYGEQITGLKVDGVRQGGPAGQAGMQKGDIITAIEGKPISDIYAYMNRLKELQPGQVVDVTIERNGLTQTLVLEL